LVPLATFLSLFGLTAANMPFINDIHAGSQYTTKMQVHGLQLRSLVIGHTLPRGSKPGKVLLDGSTAHDVSVQTTNRGVEVTVPVQGSGPHTLTVTTG